MYIHAQASDQWKLLYEEDFGLEVEEHFGQGRKQPEYKKIREKEIKSSKREDEFI